jgi:hypothetical protein
MTKVKEHSDDAKPLRLEPEPIKTFPLYRAQDRSASGYPLRLPE